MLLGSTQSMRGRPVARGSGMPKARGPEPAIMIPNIGEYGGILKAPNEVFLLWRIRNVSPRLEVNQAREVCRKVCSLRAIEIINGEEGGD